MREILFRGKRTDTGEWIEGSLVTQGQRRFIDTFKVKESYTKFFGYHNFIEVIPETVGQYTGIIDKYDDRKWEGDIFYWDERLYIIEFDEDVLAWYAEAYFEPDYSILLSSFSSDEIGVIGNIHDNPELLNTNNEREGSENGT